MSDTSQAADVLARTLWGEARGCGAAGMRNVSMVIMNRVKHPRWWGHDIVSVCLDPEQFSCWNANDPNLPKLKAVTTEDPAFRLALTVAQAAIAGTVTDITKDADSYYAVTMRTPPAWAARATRTVTDGWHWFCRVELPAESGQPEAPTASIEANLTPPAETADQLMAQEQKSLDTPES
jgi:N-acetylmuramoyl-L-alanine amidase